MHGVRELVGVDDRGPADAPAFGRGDGAGVGGAIEGVGPFHLPEQGEQDDREPGHRVGGVAGVDLDGVGKVPDSDAAFGELVDQVEGVAHGAPEPVQGVNHDDVTGARVAEGGLQPGPVGGGAGAGLLVQVDPLWRDAGLCEGVELAVEVLLGGRARAYPRSMPEPYR